MVRAARLGDLSVSYVNVIGRSLESRGIDPGPLFRRFRISRAMRESLDARISIPRFMRLGRAALDLAGDECLGLDFGAHTRLTDLGLAGAVALAAPTLGEALETLVRFERLGSYHVRGQSVTERLANGDLALRFYSIRPYNRFNTFVVDSILAGWWQFLVQLWPQSPPPVNVQFEYPDRGLGERFEQHFRAPVGFEARHNQLQVSARTLAVENPLGQAGLFRKLQGVAEDELARLRAGWTIVDRAREALTPLLDGDAPSLKELGDRLGMAPWTLRRRLAEHGWTFRGLLEDARRELALAYARHTALNGKEIAYLLGFSTPPAFHRAFKRWHGKSLGELRRAIGGETDGGADGTRTRDPRRDRPVF